VNIYAKIVKANTTDTRTNRIRTLTIIPGNSIGRSCHRIRAKTIAATTRMMIRFRFMVYLLTGMREPSRERVLSFLLVPSFSPRKLNAHVRPHKSRSYLGELFL
jgi:hypothetical protein